MRKLDSGLRLFGLIMAIIVICLGTLPFVSSHQATETLDLVKEVAARERAYNSVMASLVAAENGERGYLLGNPSALAAYQANAARIPAALAELARGAESERERQLIARIAALGTARLDAMAATIARHRDGRAAPMADGQTAVDERELDELQGLLALQAQHLADRRNGLREALAVSLKYNTALGVGASLATLVVLVAAVYIGASSLRERSEAARQAGLLARANAEHAAQASLRADRSAATARMLQALDSSKGTAELEHVLPGFLQQLLPASSGGIYLYRHGHQLLDLKAAWGAAARPPAAVCPEDCWGLRLGKPHMAAEACGLCCCHGDGAATDQPCLPMISQGEVLGLMVVSGEAARSPELVAPLAEQLGLAINNVILRATLHRQSIVDPLTGLYNRRHLDEALQRELSRSERESALVMIDLDHFKLVNDTYGHEGGDLVLQEAARMVSARVRANDLVCRHGGEELVILMPDCGADAALRCAEQLRQSLTELVIPCGARSITGLSASFGVAAWPAHGRNGAELLAAADRALYAAKSAGRNRVVRAEPLDEKVVALHGWVRSA
ncbi:hypothetical protein B0920_07295 [Massilia sp. KIM]|uniref:diguanylate cyclase n=1 Tax=Massilia sp. KIM TaxID=1955422 RepID=UPI0009C9C772|nr:diguanylate cyclase [Massilia sp. KIM]OON63200.1 hypothetical protein B0920_07295 [Massilia sp. KIM]